MIPYDLIIPSATRPHLFRATLQSLLEHVDQPPHKIWVHDDVVFPEHRGEVRDIVAELAKDIPWVVEESDPPKTHGHALAWLLDQPKWPYVLYTQDDFITLRSIPVGVALEVMHRNGLHQIRFNKRDTMDKKGKEGQEFHKFEVRYRCGGDECQCCPTVGTFGRVFHVDTEAQCQDCHPGHVLCISDHWYFQTGVWRIDRIRPFVRAWVERDPAQFREHAEAKLNHVMNGRMGSPFFPNHALPVTIPADLPSQSPQVRDAYAKTYIWGPIGEPPYVRHIGNHPDDWAMYHLRDGQWSGAERAKAKDYSGEGH